MSTDAISITIDRDVFEFLKSMAEPFIDTPNDVLRRLLLRENTKGPANSAPRQTGISSESLPSTKRGDSNLSTQLFVDGILKKDFGSNYGKVSPYQYMFKIGESYAYFQNFNKKSDKLWFRISKRPLKLLIANKDNSILYFTNPAERIAYKIPVCDLKAAMDVSGWERDYLEVNIDRTISRWNALGWSISEYLRQY